MASLDKLTKKDLLEICVEKGVEVDDADTKMDLIEKIQMRENELEIEEQFNALNVSNELAELEEMKLQIEGAEEVVDDELPGNAAVADSNSTQKKENVATGHKAQRRTSKSRTERTTNTNSDDAIYGMKPIKGLAPSVRQSRSDLLAEAAQEANESYDKLQQEIAASIRDPYHTLKGTVLGAKTPQKSNDTYYANYMVQYGPHIVQIPSFLFWYDARDEEKHPSRRAKEDGNKMQGLEIEFNALSIEQAGKVIYGTRLYSTKIRRCEEWYAKVKDGKWYIEEGSVVKATVMRTNRYHLVVEYAGAETRIPVSELSYSFMNYVDAETYYPGKEIRIKIKSIKRAELPKASELATFNYPVEFRASVKDAYKDPQIVNFDKFDVGDTPEAVITNIYKYNDQNKVLYFCNVSGFITIAADLGPRVGIGHIPSIGDKVSVVIRNKDEKSHNIYGQILNIRKQRNNVEDYSILNI